VTPHPPAPPLRRPARWVGWACLTLLLVLVAFLAVLGLQVYRAKEQVDRLQARAEQAVQRLRDAPDGAARADLLDRAVVDVQVEAVRLRQMTQGTVWTAGTALPGLGPSLEGVAVVADAVALVSTDVLPVLGDTAGDLLDGPRRAPLDLSALTGRRPALAAALRDVRRARVQVDALDRDVPVVSLAAGRVAPRLRQLEDVTAQAAALAVHAGPLTGEQGPRRYLVVLQSPAESRGTGGLVGGFVELRVQRGAVQVTRLGTSDDLRNGLDDLPAVGGGFDETWAPYGARDRWQSSNLSLDFPAVARLWRAMYDAQYGGRLDGVVGITPEALSGLLELTGPVPLPGEGRVGADELPRLLEVDLYRRFPEREDEPLRDAYQLEVLRRLLDAALGPLRLDGRAPDALRRAADGGLRLASAHRQEQAWLATTRVGGALPGAGPFVAWSTQSAGGSKLDVYLHRRLSYERGDVEGGRRRVTATAELRNDTPRTGLPEYVTLRPDLSREERERTPAGTHEVLVATYLSPGARVLAVEVDGERVEPRTGQEQGHPVVLVQVDLAPGGGSARVRVLADEPASDLPVRTLRQPFATGDVLRLG
jgi:hypothetical protein